MVNTLTGADFNSKQIERVCHRYGQCLLDQELDKISDEVYDQSAFSCADQRHYVSVDGSMYLTREDGWKEIKLGRIYKESDCTQSSDGHGVSICCSPGKHPGVFTKNGIPYGAFNQ